MNRLPKFLFGFNKETELLNGRGAMIAFSLLLIFELIFKKGILEFF